jgi:predicted RNA-binding protein with PIN domain
MYYYVDGYNLIFSLTNSKASLQTLREELIALLRKQFASCNLSGTIVFDGSLKAGEESGLSYPSPLIVAYTTKGKSADEYIVECVLRSQNPKEACVITNDKSLVTHVRSAGAKTQSNAEFIHWLQKRKAKGRKSKVDPVESPKNIERLLAIFEERLKNPET